MEQKQKRRRFNIVDVLIVVAILAAAGFFVWRFILPSDGTSGLTLYRYTLTMDQLEMPYDYHEGKVAVGDEVIFKTNTVLGKITNIDIKPSRSYTSTDTGEIVLTTRPLSNHVTFIIEGEGYFPETGGMLLDENAFFVNRPYDIIIGNNGFTMRLIQLTQDEPADED